MRERDGEMRLEKLSTGRSLFDFTISAPKDLSILALEDSRMIAFIARRWTKRWSKLSVGQVWDSAGHAKRGTRLTS